MDRIPPTSYIPPIGGNELPSQGQPTLIQDKPAPKVRTVEDKLPRKETYSFTVSTGNSSIRRSQIYSINFRTNKVCRVPGNDEFQIEMTMESIEKFLKNDLGIASDKKITLMSHGQVLTIDIFKNGDTAKSEFTLVILK